MKKVLVFLVVVVAVVATVPLWGGCDTGYRLCTATCTVRHLGSDAKEAGCKTRCAIDKTACLADSGAKNVQQFMEGLQK